MSEEEVLVESSENIVDVEEELRERKLEAIERATEADDEDDVEHGSPYVSPPIEGTGDVFRRRGTDRVRLRLMEELPDGTNELTVRLPSTRRIDDETHELNRLLSRYGIEPDELADLNGRRLPLRPKGDLSDPESLSYGIDYPPVPTLPNKALYRGRRACERLGLLRWGQTPKAKRDFIGDITTIQHHDGRNAPAMPKSALGLFYPLGLLPEDESTVVPTDRGIAALIAGGLAATASLPLLAAAATENLAALLVSFVFTTLMLVALLPIAAYAVSDWASRGWERFNCRFFPDAD